MPKPTSIERDPLYVVAPPIVTNKTKRFGHIIVWGTFTLMFLLAIIQFLNTNEYIRKTKKEIVVNKFVKIRCFI